MAARGGGGSYCCLGDRKRSIMTFFIVIVAVMIIIIIIPVLLGHEHIFLSIHLRDAASWGQNIHHTTGGQPEEEKQKEGFRQTVTGERRNVYELSNMLLWRKTKACCLGCSYFSS